MKTTTDNQQKKSPIMFLKYGSNEKGQHFETVIQRMPDGKKEVIARVFKEWDVENKKTKYIARDISGKEIFSGHNLYALEKEFIEKAKAEKAVEEKNVPELTQENPKNEKENELKEIRVNKQQNKEQEKENGIER